MFLYTSILELRKHKLAPTEKNSYIAISEIVPLIQCNI